MLDIQQGDCTAQSKQHSTHPIIWPFFDSVSTDTSSLAPDGMEWNGMDDEWMDSGPAARKSEGIFSQLVLFEVQAQSRFIFFSHPYSYRYINSGHLPDYSPLWLLFLYDWHSRCHFLSYIFPLHLCWLTEITTSITTLKSAPTRSSPRHHA